MFNHNQLKYLLIMIFLTTIIFAIGLAFLYSATYQNHSQDFLNKQILWFAIALLAGIIILTVDYKKWLELGYPLYFINLILLLLVIILGKTRLGAQRWLGVGNIAFQPSEFSKLIMIMTLARFLGQRTSGFSQNAGWSKGVFFDKTMFTACVLTLIPFVLILKQPDLGTAVTLIPILFAMLYVWGASLWTLILTFGLALLSSPFLWHLLKDYQKRRILVFINPNLDPLGAGYTIIQSKIAIGSGRFLGKGWLAGTQNQLNFLPERHTDFIFSVVGEEWGFAGAAFLIILYLVLILYAYSYTQKTANLSGKLFASGLLVLLSFQILINISMTIGLVPVVGLPLPLISYGGSSLLTTIVSVAFLLNIGLRKTIF
ncbi:MAG: rod shape-determining protein RodA [Candidatus Omnitrophota bacterium]